MVKACIALMERIRSARQDEAGSATVEAVLWLPFFIAAFTLVVDGSMIFHNHSQILRVTQDANRAFSVGRYTDEETTESQIEAALSSLSDNAAATTTVANGIISTTVTVPAGDIDVIGIFKSLTTPTITIRAQHLMES